MTIQEAYKKITSTEDLKKKAIEALKNGKGDEFLKEQGIDITVKQIEDYIQTKKSGELSKEELDLAAGGCNAIICNTLFSMGTVLIGCTISGAMLPKDNPKDTKYTDCF